MDTTMLKGKWQQVQGDIKRKWGKLTDDDIMKTEGDIDRLVGIIQEKYGEATETVKQEIAALAQKVTHGEQSETAPADEARRSVSPAGAKSWN